MYAAGTMRTAHGVGLVLPLGPIRFMQRYQWSDIVLGRTPSPDQLQAQSVAFYSPNPRVQVSYQAVTDWYEGGETRQWDQVDANVRLLRATTLRVAAKVPEVTDIRYLDLRLTQALSKTFSLSVEYGAVSAFHPKTLVDAQQPRVLVMIRRASDVQTPAAGGRVSGRVLDDLGHPVAGVAVRLGEYLAMTDEAGGYDFRRVPAGTFELDIDEARLPAAYAKAAGAISVPVSRGSDTTRTLRVIPLDSLGGLIYVDRNLNGRPDGGEAQSGVVVHANGRSTTTDERGQYRFDNLPPGMYAVQLDVARLRTDLVPAALVSQHVVLAPGQPVRGVDFPLVNRVRTLVLQEIAP
jgi:hypothetical protein